VPTRDVLQAGEVRLARIESVRALAALAVLIGHVWLFSNLDQTTRLIDTYPHRVLYSGGFGVFVFFGLSGYLLFWPFVRRHFGDGTPMDLGRYARNRALRILPLYWFAVVFLLLVQNHGGTFELFWRHMLFVQSMWRDSLGAVDGSLWSVAVEIQFYVLLPFLAAGLALVTRRSRRGAAAVLLALAVLAAVARHQLAGRNGDLWGYQLPATFQFFVGGMVVALLRHSWEERRPAWLDGPLGSSTLWALASLPLWAIVIDRFGAQDLVAVATFLLIGALVLPLRRGVVVAALEWRPLALLGVASFSLYVWHVPIVDALGIEHSTALALLAPLLSVVAAFVSYRLVEAPVLRLRRQWAGASAPQVGSPT
jgi:peptidoglycan/LPS O-acetylase OafA/YrhL